jgi:hypothetical protein
LPKVLQYNNFVLSAILRDPDKELLPIFEPYLADNYLKTFRKYDDFQMTQNVVCDRSGAIPHFVNMTYPHKMPDYDPTFNKSFQEIAEERARELLQTNKQIKVCWSGGIDSTYVLLLLGNMANDRSQITVYGSYSSIIESGDIFDRYIKDKFKYEINVYASEKIRKSKDDSVYITGFQGNQIFGPTDDFFATNQPQVFFHHTMGTPETIYEDYKTNVDPELLEFLQPAIDRSPRKIETVCDLRWYCIFNMDWHNGLYFATSEMPKERFMNTHHFFNTEDFQKWAITTKDPFTKIKGNSKTHRWQMRDYIADCGLVEYSKNKPKAISNLASASGWWFFLTENLDNIYYDKSTRGLTVGSKYIKF